MDLEQQASGQPAGGAKPERFADIESTIVADEVEKTPETPKEEPAKQPPAEEPTESDDDDGEEKPRKKGGFTKKLEKKDAEIAYWKAQAEGKGEKPAEQPKAEAEPTPEDFETHAEYYKALAKYEAKQLFTQQQAEREQQAKEQSLQKEQEAKAKTYTEQAEELKKTVTDFDDVMESYKGPWSEEIRLAILDSERSAEVSYWLAKNPAEAAKMADMTGAQLARFMGRAEAQIGAKTESKSETPPPKTTKAPPPITPVGHTASTVGKDPYRGDEMDYEEYKEWKARNTRN